MYQQNHLNIGKNVKQCYESGSAIMLSQTNMASPTLSLIGKNYLVACLLILFMLCFSGQSHASIAVVVSPNSSLSSISKNEVKAIFLGRRKKLQNGVIAAPVYQNNYSDIYKVFNRKILGKAGSRISQYWNWVVLSGTAIKPPSVADDQAVIDHVINTTGGIGYIHSESANEQIKVLFTIP